MRTACGVGAGKRSNPRMQSEGISNRSKTPVKSCWFSGHTQRGRWEEGTCQDELFRRKRLTIREHERARRRKSGRTS